MNAVRTETVTTGWTHQRSVRSVGTSGQPRTPPRTTFVLLSATLTSSPLLPTAENRCLANTRQPREGLPTGDSEKSPYLRGGLRVLEDGCGASRTLRTFGRAIVLRMRFAVVREGQPGVFSREVCEGSFNALSSRWGTSLGLTLFDERAGPCNDCTGRTSVVDLPVESR